LSAGKAVQDFIAVLRTIPAETIAPDRIGLSGPAHAPDLPLLAVSLAPSREAPIGIGGVVGLSRLDEQWTTTTGTRTSGRLHLDIWAATTNGINQLAEAVIALVDSSAAALRDRGFIRFETGAIRPAEGLLLADSTTALRAGFDFSIVHEDIAGLVSGPGGNIREIDVAIDSQFNQNFTITKKEA
jgi:hypothetical protein